MLFGIGNKKAEVMEHWYSLVPGFSTSTKDFYAAVETELKERQVPGLDIAYVDFAEGGVLSAKRQYLRFTRERLVFDICAAPFGTAFFFSCRFAQIPAVVKIWELLVLLIGLCAVGFWGLVIFSKVLGFFGLILFPLLLLAFIVVAIYTMRNAVAMGLKDLDASLIKMPVIGAIYEAWFRKETYYRHDTRLMYCDTINAVVKAKVEEVTGEKGIKLIKFNDYNSVVNEFYIPTFVSLPRT